ncbi:MAG: uncharacterized protein JWQ24_3300 [Tardiphaga sp.]|nr:uncharacterized protein [Tardiphaga sp.]
MAIDKIAAFYDDPGRIRCDARSTTKAWHLRSLTLCNSPYWRTQRWLRFRARFGEGPPACVAKTLQRPHHGFAGGRRYQAFGTSELRGTSSS